MVNWRRKNKMETIKNDSENKKIIEEEDDDGVGRKLDEKLMELQSLFEVSQTLNSSLNLKSILDNMLLTPMGKMMITRGIVLLYTSKKKLRVETLKGLPTKLIGEEIELKHEINEPSFIDNFADDINVDLEFFKKNNIIILLPIRSSDNTLGYIGFGEKILNKIYIKSELEYLKSLTNIAATSIENGLMVMQLQEVNRRLDKKIQELNTLFDIGKELNSTLDSDKILNLLCYAIMGEMIINRCIIFTQEKDNMKLAISKGHRNEKELSNFKNDEILKKLTSITESVKLEKDTKYDYPLSYFQEFDFKLVVPMRIHNNTKGIMAIGERINRVDFQDYDVEFLSTLGNEATICLENARLFEEALEKKRMEEELAIAREIQQKLLPTECPELENYEISAINVTCLQVSGDYYECLKLDSDRVCLAIADVSGKGTGASLLMANLQAVLHALIESDLSLSEVTSKINNLIHRNTNYDKFITFFIGILNIKENNFTFVNAGHNPPVKMDKDGNIHLLTTGGLILGMMPNMPYEQETVTLKKKDWIVMFTDGVTEAVDINDEEFEEHRLEEVIRKNRTESCETMKDKILEAVNDFSRGCPQGDDITLLNLKMKH